MEGELLFIFLLALLLLGPRKLPELSRKLGKAIAVFKCAKSEFTSQIENEVRRLAEDESSKILPAESINTFQAPSQAPTITVPSTLFIPSETTVNVPLASQVKASLH